MITKQCIKLFGVPGSGKTTECLEYIKKFIAQGYHISDICFTTYTRAGIQSIKDKLSAEKITIFKDDNFRTLNSLTWRMCELSKENFLDDKERDAFLRNINITSDSDNGNGESDAELLMGVYDMVSNMSLTPVQKMDDECLYRLVIRAISDKNITMNPRCITIALRRYVAWKSENDKYDYVDSILLVLDKEIDIGERILIVDEAQDLTALQGALIDFWTRKMEREIFIIAGDDLQTVHEWRGADNKYFLNYSNDNMVTVILEHTHRIPQNIAALANDVAGMVRVKHDKKIISDIPDGMIIYSPSASEKQVINAIETVRTGESLFMLFRTNRFLNYMSDVISKNLDISYSILGGRKTKKSTNNFLVLNNALNRIVLNEPLHVFEALEIIDCLILKEFMERGLKSRLEKMDRFETIQCEEFLLGTKKWKPLHDKGLEHIAGLMIDRKDIKKDIVNHLLLKKYIISKDIFYEQGIRNKLLSNNKIFEFRIDDKMIKFNTNVFLGTYHGSKGLEADNVMVFLGSVKTFKDIDDSEKRVFYTAITRARKNLALIGANSFSDSNDIPKGKYIEDYFKVPILKHRT